MKHRRRLIRAVLLVLIAWLAWWCWGRVDDDPVLGLLYWLVVGVLGALFFLSVVLPLFADAIGTSVFLSGEKQAPKAEEKDEEMGEPHEDPDVNASKQPTTTPEVKKGTHAE